MHGWIAAIGCLTLWMGTLAVAAEPLPVPAPAPAPDELGVRPAAGRDDSRDSVEHLLKAAEHLQAAGLQADADKMRTLARERALRDDDLGHKEAELECLQREVDRLRSLLGQTPDVVVEIVALEVQRGKLGMKAREFEKFIGFGAVGPAGSGTVHDSSELTNEAAPATSLLEANPIRLPLFKELREKGVIRVLAEPTLLAHSRRPVKYTSGGEAAAPGTATNATAGSRIPFGTQVEVVAAVLGNHRVRLQTSLELRELIHGDVAPLATSRVRTARMETDVEMQIGQTLTIGRWQSPRPGRQPEPAEILILVTPRLASVPVPAPEAKPLGPTEDAATLLPTEDLRFLPVTPVLKRRVDK